MVLKRVAVLSILISFAATSVSGDPNYRDALTKSLIFFQGQRSGKLPTDQNITWRSDSGLSDGSSENVDLSGGYYDAGDNIKFGLPMAFTTTVLAWGVLEFGQWMPDELDQAREAVRWGTDYLLKASSKLPDALYVQVGDPVLDHKCWVRPEDGSVQRPVFKVTPTTPGTEVAAETAAAMAAASLVFRHVDLQYSKKLLDTAEKTFAFADKYKGNYSAPLSDAVCPFYCSYSGYQDELLWGAAWLYMATHNSSYLDYAQSLGLDYDSCEFSWDTKLPGARILLSSDSLIEKKDAVFVFQQEAEKFVCSVLPGSLSLSVDYTPGGLLHKKKGSNMQYVTSTSFLLSVYAKYMKACGATFSCGDLVVTPTLLGQQAKHQVDYILGSNPKGMSYMVGFGDQFPQHIHHRASSIPEVELTSNTIGCDEGFQYFHSNNANPNVLIGAIVGGPDEFDAYTDDRGDYGQSEPATYINAPIAGTLAYIAANFQS